MSRYTASSQTVGGAEPFRMQATTLGQYLLFGKASDFLAAAPSDEPPPAEGTAWGDR